MYVLLIKTMTVVSYKWVYVNIYELRKEQNYEIIKKSLLNVLNNKKDTK